MFLCFHFLNIYPFLFFFFNSLFLLFLFLKGEAIKCESTAKSTLVATLGTFKTTTDEDYRNNETTRFGIIGKYNIVISQPQQQQQQQQQQSTNIEFLIDCQFTAIKYITNFPSLTYMSINTSDQQQPITDTYIRQYTIGVAKWLGKNFESYLRRNKVGTYSIDYYVTSTTLPLTPENESDKEKDHDVQWHIRVENAHFVHSSGQPCVLTYFNEDGTQQVGFFKVEQKSFEASTLPMMNISHHSHLSHLSSVTSSDEDTSLRTIEIGNNNPTTPFRADIPMKYLHGPKVPVGGNYSLSCPGITALKKEGEEETALRIGFGRFLNRDVLLTYYSFPQIIDNNQ